MGLKIKKILRVNITTSPKIQVLEEIRKYLKKVQSSKFKVQSERIKPFVIFTPNPEIIVYAQKDANFRQIVNTARINIPDGQGVCWAIKKIYGLRIERIGGADLMLDLVGLSSQKGFRVGLIGGREGVAVETAECLREKYSKFLCDVLSSPEVILIDNLSFRHPDRSRCQSGEWRDLPHSVSRKIPLRQLADRNDKGFEINSTKYIILNTSEKQPEETEEYFKNLVDSIVKKKIDILFVALGFPKQEYFIDTLKRYLINKAYSNKINNRRLVLMTVGGSFDYISGRVPRAPEFMRKRGLEWLFRLISHPRRLSRQIKGAEFFYRVLTFSSSSSVEN